MPKSTNSILEKIHQSEIKMRELIQQRNKELLDIITKYKAISIDNKLLAGFLIFALNPQNKDHYILKEFKELAGKSKSPSNPGQQNKKPVKETN